MPLYVIERELAEKIQLSELGVGSREAQDLDAGLRWLFSFLSADRLRSYCLFEAPDAEVVRRVVRRSGFGDDAVVEVERIDPSMLGDRH